ncbi:MAG: TonB-dependent receptor plug domain-containing protein [Bacteroidetes bacterium]|nr:TonB-dependent receptor plug domain-containing protein [Bacteroidota bacterium]MBU1423930.1 TonB-dependent receptor plug domain-containing protein [Bacteroidota bacterium]MBU2635511.1 TonB-dependent receptor plug domain-containing protein [Bacteroidota bacterium]
MNKSKILISILFSIFLTINVTFSQNGVILGDTTSVFETPDTSTVDTSIVIEHLRSPEIISKTVAPIPSVGILNEYKADNSIIDSVQLFTDYRYTGNLIENLPGAFFYNLGSIGQPHQLTINGLDGRSIAVMTNGIGLNESLIGVYNFHLFPAEELERIEYINGSRAFIYGLNATGGVINLVPKFHSSKRPYTKIRYSESNYEETIFDGLFAQNILPDLNFSSGVQRISYDGRFTNSAYDAWLVRVKLRYNLSEKFNIYISEIYNQNKLGLNGGINVNETQSGFTYDNLRAVVKNPDSYEKLARNDLQLGAAACLPRITGLADSTSVTNLTFFLSNQMRSYRDEENTRSPNGIFQKLNHHSRWIGVRIDQRLNLLTKEDNSDYIKLDLGSEIQSRQILQSPNTGYKSSKLISIFGKGDFIPSDLMSTSAYSRYDNYLNNSTLGYGGDVNFKLTDHFTLNAGYSKSYRYPTFQELYWRDITVTGEIGNFKPERHNLFESGFEFRFDKMLTLKTNIFSRKIDNTIYIKPKTVDFPFPGLEFLNAGRSVLTGINSSLTLNIWKFSGSLNTTYFITQKILDTDNQYPKYFTSGELLFRDIFFDNHLDLKAAVRGRVVSKQKGFEFNPQVGLLVPSISYELGTGGSFDAMLIGKIGSAVVHIILENVLNNQYAVTTFYPIQDRSLRFGITWEFEN